jgi:serine/threonine protein kinase
MNEIEFDFLRKMVVFDPDSRLTCRQLLNHPYFT